jgi:hypothetical protein
MSTVLHGPLVQFIAAEIGRAERLLAVHVPDGQGRCRGCPVRGVALTPWPCTLHQAAVAARKR